MIGSLSSSQANIIRRMAADFETNGGYVGGLPQFFNDILATLAASNVGITALSGDVDSVAKDGGHFSQDPDNTSGLVFAYKAGRVYSGAAVIIVSAGTLTLAASQTNYIEVDHSGTVSSNTAGFTAGRGQLFQVSTGASTITSTVIKKAFITVLGPGSIPGAILSAIAATKSISLPLGSIGATTSFTITAPCAGTITAAIMAAAATATANDTDYWTFAITNKGQTGAGSTAVLAATNANTTKLTGGSTYTAYNPRAWTLNGTGANLIFAANDVLEITFTKAGSATTLTETSLRLDMSFAG